MTTRPNLESAVIHASNAAMSHSVFSFGASAYEYTEMMVPLKLSSIQTGGETFSAACDLFDETQTPFTGGKRLTAKGGNLVFRNQRVDGEDSYSAAVVFPQRNLAGHTLSCSFSKFDLDLGRNIVIGDVPYVIQEGAENKHSFPLSIEFSATNSFAITLTYNHDESPNANIPDISYKFPSNYGFNMKKIAENSLLFRTVPGKQREALNMDDWTLIYNTDAIFLSPIRDTTHVVGTKYDLECSKFSDTTMDELPLSQNLLVVSIGQNPRSSKSATGFILASDLTPYQASGSSGLAFASIAGLFAVAASVALFF